MIFDLSHPKVAIDPDMRVLDRGLSQIGRARRGIDGDRMAPWSRADRDQPGTQGAQDRREPRHIAPIADHRGRAQWRDRPRLDGLCAPGSARGAGRCAFFQTTTQRGGLGNSSCRPGAGRAGTGAHLGSPSPVTTVLVGHGGVGTLLWCHISGHPISRAQDQSRGGHIWAAQHTGARRIPVRGWRRMEDVGAQWA